MSITAYSFGQEQLIDGAHLYHVQNTSHNRSWEISCLPMGKEKKKKKKKTAESLRKKTFIDCWRMREQSANIYHNLKTCMSTDNFTSGNPCRRNFGVRKQRCVYNDVCCSITWDSKKKNDLNG